MQQPPLLPAPQPYTYSTTMYSALPPSPPLHEDEACGQCCLVKPESSACCSHTNTPTTEQQCTVQLSRLQLSADEDEAVCEQQDSGCASVSGSSELSDEQQPGLRHIPPRFQKLLADEVRNNPASHPGHYTGQALLRCVPLGSKKRRQAINQMKAAMAAAAAGHTTASTLNPDAQPYVPTNMFAPTYTIHIVASTNTQHTDTCGSSSACSTNCCYGFPSAGYTGYPASAAVYPPPPPPVYSVPPPYMQYPPPQPAPNMMLSSGTGGEVIMQYSQSSATHFAA